MKATSSQSNKRGVSLATLAFVAMLMIGQTAPMEYIRDSTYHQETVSYDTVGISVAENTQTDVIIDLMSTVSGAPTGLDVGSVPVFRAERAQEGGGMKSAGAHFHVQRL